ncbi:T9SS type A sorting domain-containing protein [Lentimicrobium sp. L6]|uniref:InlB B-repeat-containing protein n=1 Tax=Lentimicrobium sp. L6 TaxID=2735916 RepID=UPI0015551A59|nr:T9SS type A sorting domain-containing protein [Lentimicrobium sp. L6]NPD86466.1 T9SS type A sorting domain-containing protein [Lentimicrobium sp. L6]
MKNRVTNLMTVLGMTFLIIMASSFQLSAQQKQSCEDVKTCNNKEWSSQKSADEFKTKQYKDGNVVLTEMIGEYLFPSGIDATGKHVIIQTFGSGEQSFYWNAQEGVTAFEGKGTKMAANGKVAGDFLNTDFPQGTAVTGGYYSLDDQEWTFLGINPEYPNLTSEDYNSVWGQSDDGSTLVGLQLFDGWSATAFKWTEDGGYENIGDDLPLDSRASGISRNGEVIFGWTSHEFGYWMPVIWSNDTYTLINGEESGEVMAASAEGNIVVGKADESAFSWSEASGYETFGSYDDYPTIVMEDGSAFGFTGVFPPPVRRAFYRSPEGSMGTFNDYAEARGMENAQAWTFYSVNDVTPDGNVFIGAAINPDGNDVSFILDFNASSNPEYTLNLSVEPQEAGEVTGSGVYEEGLSVEISATANEGYSFVNWTREDGTLVSSEATTSIIMPANDYSLIANFSVDIVYYTLILEMDPENAGEVTGAGSYEAGEEVNITAEVTGYFAFDNWTNEMGDVVSEDVNTIIIMPSQDLTLTANLHSTVGISDVLSNNIFVYPNPAWESITIKGMSEKMTHLNIINAMGQTVLHSVLTSEKQTLDISELSSGIYMIQITDGLRIIENKRLLIK